MSTQTIERMAVEVDGSGDAVIMIHGLGGTSNTFSPQLAVLNGHRVIRPDLPGSGRSAANGAITIDLLADRIIRMAEVLGVERAHFAGHSMGTILCQHIAVREPRRVRSLALFGPLMEPADQARQGLKERAAKARGEGMAEIADAVVQASTSADTRTNAPAAAALVRELLMRQCQNGYAATCEALAGATAADASRIACPTLLLTGNDDPIAPPSVARALGEQIEDAQVVILDRCGHWSTLERAREVNEALRNFYTSRAR